MPNVGQFVLHSMANPPLKAGDYTLQGRMDIAGASLPLDPTAPYDGQLRITSPRYSLPPEQMLSTFPPANSEGAYENRLPQIVLKRRTLPWEREAAPGDFTTSWLALVVIAEGEGTLSGDVPVAQCVTPGVTLTGPGDMATGIYLGVTRTVIDKVFPTKAEVPLLCHVREVDIRDTELANGDDDGFVAVVMASRLPQYDRTRDKPVRYLACLINLEGQLDSLAVPPRIFVPDFLATADVFDVRTLARRADPDRLIMGGTASQALRADPPDVEGTARRTAKPRTPRASASPSSDWATTTSRIERTALTAPAADAGRLVRDGMLEGFRDNVEHWVFSEPTYRFPVLAHWSFTVSGTGGFEPLMRGLDVGLLGTTPRAPRVPPGAPPPPPAPRPPAEFTETGHVGLPHLTRRGERVRAWYRGPLASHPTTREAPDAQGRLLLAHVSDQLRLVVPDGREDLSLAAAFEIGRLLALSQPSIVRALLAWRAEQFGAERARRLVADVSQTVSFLTAALSSRAADLGAVIGRQLVLGEATDPARILAPSRPLVDPGRPLPFARDGGLEQLLAEGFGFSAQDVARSAGAVGVVAALQQTAVPVTGAEATAPLVKGPGIERLRDRLTAEVDRLTEGALAARTSNTLTTPRARSKEPDALDALIERAERGRGAPR
jgi:hypothetical protein